MTTLVRSHGSSREFLVVFNLLSAFCRKIVALAIPLLSHLRSNMILIVSSGSGGSRYAQHATTRQSKSATCSICSILICNILTCHRFDSGTIQLRPPFFCGLLVIVAWHPSSHTVQQQSLRRVLHLDLEFKNRGHEAI